MNARVDDLKGHKKSEAKRLWKEFKKTSHASVTNCPDSNMLAGYIDHRLSKEESKAVEAHIAGCDPCLESLLLIKKETLTVSRPLPEGELEPIFDLVTGKTSLAQEIKKNLSEFFASISYNVPALAASVLVVCLAAFLIGMKTGTDIERYNKAIASELLFSFDADSYNVSEGNCR